MPHAKKGLNPRGYSEWLDGVAGGAGSGGELGEDLDLVALTRSKFFTGLEGKGAQDKAVAELALACLEDFRVAATLQASSSGLASSSSAAPPGAPPPPELALLTKLLEKFS